MFKYRRTTPARRDYDCIGAGGLLDTRLGDVKVECKYLGDAVIQLQNGRFCLENSGSFGTIFEHGGIYKGDFLTEIDGESTSDMSRTHLQTKLQRIPIYANQVGDGEGVESEVDNGDSISLTNSDHHIPHSPPPVVMVFTNPSPEDLNDFQIIITQVRMCLVSTPNYVEFLLGWRWRKPIEDPHTGSPFGIGTKRSYTITRGTVYARYSQLHDLNTALVSQRGAAISSCNFPGKHILKATVSRFDPSFLKKRMKQLNLYFNKLVKVEGVVGVNFSSVFQPLVDFLGASVAPTALDFAAEAESGGNVSEESDSSFDGDGDENNVNSGGGKVYVMIDPVTGQEIYIISGVVIDNWED